MRINIARNLNAFEYGYSLLFDKALTSRYLKNNLTEIKKEKMIRTIKLIISKVFKYYFYSFAIDLFNNFKLI